MKKLTLLLLTTICLASCVGNSNETYTKTKKTPTGNEYEYKSTAAKMFESAKKEDWVSVRNYADELYTQYDYSGPEEYNIKALMALSYEYFCLFYYDKLATTAESDEAVERCLDLARQAFRRSKPVAQEALAPDANYQLYIKLKFDI